MLFDNILTIRWQVAIQPSGMRPVIRLSMRRWLLQKRSPTIRSPSPSALGRGPFGWRLGVRVEAANHDAHPWPPSPQHRARVLVRTFNFVPHPENLSHFCSLKLSVLVRGVKQHGFPDVVLPPLLPSQLCRTPGGAAEPETVTRRRPPCSRGSQWSLRCSCSCVFLSVPASFLFVIPVPGGLLRVLFVTPECAISQQPIASSQKPIADSR
jgi:hypothetical protein